MGAVLSRALSAGALAGAVSGIAAVLVFVVAGTASPEGGLDPDELVGATINYLVLAVLLGATTGAALAVPVGIALGLLRHRLTTSVRARLATAALCVVAVLVLGAVLSGLGIAGGYLPQLVGPALVVAPAVGAWRAARVLALSAPGHDAVTVVLPAVEQGRHRRRRL